MRKIVTLLFVLVAIGANAQFVPGEIFSHLRQVSKQDLPARKAFTNPNRSSSNIAIDYDSFDVKYTYAHTPPDSMYYYSWNVNMNNFNAQTFSLRYALQTYDTLIDVNNNFAGTARAGATVRVDSFDIYLAHENLSGLEDTIIISVFDKSTATVTGTGVNAKLNSPPVWSDTLYTSQNIFPTTDFYVITLKPGVSLPAGHTFGIRTDFAGDTADQLYVLASFRDECSSLGLGDTNKIAPRNSSYYFNNGAGSGFFNYTTNHAYNVPNACKYFLIQNLLVYPYITVSTPDPATVKTTAATNVASATATLNGTVNANGASTTASFEYGLTTAYGSTAAASPATVTGSVTTNISANISGLAASTTYHYRAKGVNAGGTTYGADSTFTTAAAGTVCTPDANVTTGISPASANVACVEQGVSYSQVYTFVVPAQVNSVTIDSVVNLPAGLTASYSKNPPTYTTNERGCMLITGTSNAPCGQYQMLIYVTINSALGTSSGELSALGSALGFQKTWIRVVSAGGTCPALNTAQTTTFAAGSCGLDTLSVTATSTNVNCFGQSTGTATATATGGSNFTYVWNNGATTAAITGLAAGTYTVTATSGANSVTATTTVTQPAAAVSVTGVVTDATGSSSNGAVNITAAGGTGTYLYNWSNTTSNEDLTGVAAGNYTVTVTDQNGCSVTAQFTVGTNIGIEGVDMLTKFSVFPNPTASNVNVQLLLNQNTDVKVELVDLNGRVILSEYAGNAKQINYVLNTSEVANGVYVIRATGSKLNVTQRLTIAK